MSKTIFFWLLTNFFLLSHIPSIFSQEKINIAPTSPEATALAKMVNYPVNMSTGISLSDTKVIKKIKYN